MHLSLGKPCTFQRERRLADNRRHEHITRRVGARQPHDVGVFDKGLPELLRVDHRRAPHDEPVGLPKAADLAGQSHAHAACHHHHPHADRRADTSPEARLLIADATHGGTGSGGLEGRRDLGGRTIAAGLPARNVEPSLSPSNPSASRPAETAAKRAHIRKNEGISCPWPEHSRCIPCHIRWPLPTVSSLGKGYPLLGRLMFAPSFTEGFLQ